VRRGQSGLIGSDTIFDGIDGVEFVNPSPGAYRVIIGRPTLIPFFIDEAGPILLPSGQTLLHLAILCGSLECMGVLLGVCPGVLADGPSEPDGTSPLALVVARERADAVALLLAHGADPFLHHRDGVTPMWLALETGSAAVVDAVVAFAEEHRATALARWTRTPIDGRLPADALSRPEVAARVRPPEAEEDEDDEEEEERRCCTCGGAGARQCFACQGWFCAFHVRAHRHERGREGQDASLS